MTDPAFAQAVEAVLTEAERHAAWTAELEAELAAARDRRFQLAGSLERLLAALGPDAARPYLPRLAAIAEAPPPRPVGKPAADGRLAALKQLLAAWPHETVTAQEAADALRARGFDLRRNYVFKPLTAMTRTGELTRLGAGRYRIVRTHPEMVALGMRGGEGG